MSIVIHSSDVELSIAAVRALRCSSKVACWNGQKIPHPFSWAIAVDPESLWFACSLPGGRACGASQERGAFIEGLWSGDVAELFIKGVDGRYQELNLAPSGAWWSMTLSEYRKRESRPQRPQLVDIISTVGDNRWEVVAAFKRRTLDVDLHESSQVHVSGMWYHPDPTFLSSHPVPGLEPDYHHGECFKEVSFVRIPG